MGEKFKEIIEKRLYKLYPFCEVTIIEERLSNSIRVHLKWFYKGVLYNYAECFGKEMLIKNNMNYQDFIAMHFVEDAIDEIQKIIIKED